MCTSMGKKGVYLRVQETKEEKEENAHLKKTAFTFCKISSSANWKTQT